MVVLSPISVNTEIGPPEDDRNFYLQSLDYGNGDSVNYTYDSQGRLTSQTYEDGDTVTYQYDNDGALAVMTDSATGITTRYYYDFTGRTMKYTESASGYSHSVEYGYDTINNLTSQKETINGVTQTTSYTYDSSNRVTSKTTNGITVEYTYDALGRISQQVTKNGSTVILTETYTYVPNSSRIASCRTVAANYDITYSYTYDDNGNILSVSDGTNTTSYVYDTANQLIRENNQEGSFTHVWVYDDAGNILSRTEYAYTTGDLEAATDTVSYDYDTEWGDLLVDYDHDQILYDTIGNPIYDNAREYIWEHGRELASIKAGSTTWSFTYDANGMRTSRTNGTTTYNYVYNGSRLVQMTVDGHTLSFTYDAAGTPVSLTADGTVYYYLTNLQGDVTGILNSNGQVENIYEYDAWGNLLYTQSIDNVLQYNPLRYRGYVYDEETKLYYLQSRYYDPVIGRWINADSQLNTSLRVLGCNTFAYCLNNPASKVDYSGNKPGDLFDTMDEAAKDFAEYINEKSISVDREYGSFIYKKTVWETRTITYYNPNIFGKNIFSAFYNYLFRGGPTKTVTKRVKVTKYSYVEPKKGTAHGVSIPINWFGARNKVAEIHTHGAYSQGYSNDNFSPDDLNEWINYLVTPLGTVRKYNPDDGSDIVIYYDAPYDPNHPERK